ncbi:unnamed protein product [Haemonchus placei]|uniref:Uncharacterized protein n=1 Tax=Haemonchus placei TaxID=6290 RepID=A0A0N4X5E2_HAEPC|nr:unnamed protein product [Haemonchus placei]
MNLTISFSAHLCSALFRYVIFLYIIPIQYHSTSDT